MINFAGKNAFTCTEENMPVITVEMYEGRTPEQKRKIVEGITEVFVQIGVPPELTQVILHDNPKKNWAIGGKLQQ